ncbi:MAG: SprT family zinc-dependent metalloprotease [Sediminibacterium sp.]|nr:SprT family zinc-dependent metalloprotease [Sediminibacterium sp.]
MQNALHQVNYGSKHIEYNLSFAIRKSLGIKVTPEGEVHVIAPVNTALIHIQKKVKTKANWILKQQSFFNSYKPHTPTRKFVSGETHLYLGKQYKLQIVQSDIDEVKIYRGTMVIYSKNSHAIYLEKLLSKWYKNKAHIHFEELLTACLDKFKKYKIDKPILYIRQMHKRWGSCTKAGKIILNTELIKAPKASIEYVIIHELCHLIHYYHNKDFYTLLQNIYPNWKKWKERLEQHV